MSSRRRNHHNDVKSLPRWAHSSFRYGSTTQQRRNKSCTTTSSNKTRNNNNTKRTHPTRNRLTIPQEELYLRTRGAVHVSQHVDATFARVLSRHVDPLVRKVLRICCCFDSASSTTTSSGNNTTTTTTTTTFNDDLASLVTFHPPRRYSPRLLPLIVLHGPPCALDRHELLHHIVAKSCSSSIQTTTTTYARPYVCWLRHHPHNHHNNSGIGMWLQEILRQCLEQDDHVSSASLQVYNNNNNKQNINKKKRKWSSAAEALVSWAAQQTKRTNHPPVIVLVLSPPSSTVVSSLGQDSLLLLLLQRLSMLRSQEGVQVCVIWSVSSSSTTSIQQQQGLSSSAQGLTGIWIHEYALPSSQVLYDAVWKELWFVSDPTTSPPLVPTRSITRVLPVLRDAFVQQHGSLVQSLLALKQVLVLEWKERGAFWDNAFRSTHCLPEEQRRVQWFGLDESARQYACGSSRETQGATMTLSWHQRIQDSQERQIAWSVVGAVLTHALEELAADPTATTTATAAAATSRSMTVVELWEDSFSQQLYAKKLQSPLLALFRRATHEATLERLLLYRSAFRMHAIDKSRAVPRRLQELYRRLNELLILVDASCHRESSPETAIARRNKELADVMEQWIYDVYMEASWLVSFSPFGPEPSNLSSLHPEPRRAIAEGLLAGVPFSSQERSVCTLPSELFALIRDCVVISREEWFRRFWTQSPGEEEAVEEMWAQFAFGVYQLEHLGLVLEKSGYTKAERMYEKTALVWCSGR